jgi:Alginate export
LLFWYWHFEANSARDIVPSLGGTPVQSTSRSHFGDELDMTAKYIIGPRSNVLFGYSHFWRGDKILAPKDANFFYTQWETNF